MKGINEYLMEYLGTFKEGFPLYPLGDGKTDEQIIEIIKRCLKEQKTVYDLGILEESGGDRKY